jgi:hypothetical protein
VFLLKGGRKKKVKKLIPFFLTTNLHWRSGNAVTSNVFWFLNKKSKIKTKQRSMIPLFNNKDSCGTSCLLVFRKKKNEFFFV